MHYGYASNIILVTAVVLKISTTLSRVNNIYITYISQPFLVKNIPCGSQTHNKKLSLRNDQNLFPKTL